MSITQPSLHLLIEPNDWVKKPCWIVSLMGWSPIFIEMYWVNPHYPFRKSFPLPVCLRKNTQPIQITAPTQNPTTSLFTLSTPTPIPSHYYPPNLPPQNLPPKHTQIKHVSLVEVQLCHDKGLCYFCNAKLSLSHRCPNCQYLPLIADPENDHNPDLETDPPDHIVPTYYPSPPTPMTLTTTYPSMH